MRAARGYFADVMQLWNSAQKIVQKLQSNKFTHYC
jgi:hypothetical protein